MDIDRKVESSKADKLFEGKGGEGGVLRQNCILDIKTDKKVGN